MISKRKLVGALTGLAISFAAAQPAAALVNGVEPDANDWRFDAVAAFGKTVNLNGVVHEHALSCAATLITPDMVVLAAHCVSGSGGWTALNPPPVGHFSVRFRRNVDGSLGTQAAGWESFHQITIDSFTFPDPAGVDLIIGHLSEPVNHIDPIQIDNPCEDVSPNDPLLIAGWGPEYLGGPKGPLRYIETTVTGVNFDLISFPSAGDPSNPCACGPINNDSGSAMLVEKAPAAKGELPQLRLVGVVRSGTDGFVVSRHQGIGPNCEFIPCPADLNNDYVVDAADMGILFGNFGVCDWVGDINGDCNVDTADLGILLQQFKQDCGVIDCTADLNGDGFVDTADLGMLLPNFANMCKGDINGDCSVDTADLGILLSNFGDCP